MIANSFPSKLTEYHRTSHADIHCTSVRWFPLRDSPDAHMVATFLATLFKDGSWGRLLGVETSRGKFRRCSAIPIVILGFNKGYTLPTPALAGLQFKDALLLRGAFRQARRMCFRRFSTQFARYLHSPPQIVYVI